MIVDTRKWRELPGEADEDETFEHIACGTLGVRKETPRMQAVSSAGGHVTTTSVVELVCPLCEHARENAHARQTPVFQSYHEYMLRNL